MYLACPLCDLNAVHPVHSDLPFLIAFLLFHAFFCHSATFVIHCAYTDPRPASSVCVSIRPAFPFFAPNLRPPRPPLLLHPPSFTRGALCRYHHTGRRRKVTFGNTGTAGTPTGADTLRGQPHKSAQVLDPHTFADRSGFPPTFSSIFLMISSTFIYFR